MTQVFFGFIPWILFWSFVGPGLWVPAVLGGFLSAAGLVAWRWFRRHDVKAMEAVTLVYFGIHAIVTLVLGWQILIVYGPVFNGLILAGMAWGTLLAKSPFTYQYARESWPREMWRSPLFIATNQIITAVWGGIFLVNAGLGALSLVFPSWSLWLNLVLANILIVSGIIFSSLFPERYVHFTIRRQIEAREPYRWPAPRFDGRPMDKNEHDVIVIGSGVGGLSAAALLAKRGLKVVVFEQHFLAGGYCTSWERGVRRNGNERFTYVFDAGVHDVSGLGQNGAVRNMMRRLDIEEDVDWRPMEHEYFLEGRHLKVPRETKGFEKQLCLLFPEQRSSLTAFFHEIEGVYREMNADNAKTGGVPTFPQTVEGMLSYPQAHPHAMRWMEQPFGLMLDTYFQDENLKKFLSTLTGYLSDDPNSLTVGAMAPIFGYYFDGGYYPAGGSQKFADALVSVIEANQGSVQLRTTVKKILVEKGEAVGVELGNGETHRARVILSNADIKRTFLDLVGRQYLPASFTRMVEKARPSTSAFMVFLGLDIVPDIAPVSMTDDLGIMLPSKADPSLAPAGHSAMTLIRLIPQEQAAAWNRSAPGYSQRKHDYADEMIRAAEKVIPNLGQHIVYRQEASPRTFERYAWSSAGAIYGQVWGASRPPLKSPLPNLYLSGAGVFPGAGIEAVVISGTLAADAIYPEKAQPQTRLSPSTLVRPHPLGTKSQAV